MSVACYGMYYNACCGGFANTFSSEVIVLLSCCRFVAVGGVVVERMAGAWAVGRRGRGRSCGLLVVVL